MDNRLFDQVYSDVLKYFTAEGNYSSQKDGNKMTLSRLMPINKYVTLVSEATIEAKGRHVEVSGRGIIEHTPKTFTMREPIYERDILRAQGRTIIHTDPIDYGAGAIVDYQDFEIGIPPLTGDEFERAKKQAKLLKKKNQPLVKHLEEICSEHKLIDKGKTIIYKITPKSFEKANN